MMLANAKCGCRLILIQKLRPIASLGTSAWIPYPLAQSITRLNADPGVASSILAQSHTLVEIDYEQKF